MKLDNDKTVDLSPKEVDLGCAVGIVTKKVELASWKSRRDPAKPRLKTTISFCHDLFGDYVSGLYLASLFRNDKEKYCELMDMMMHHNIDGYKHILGFTGYQDGEISRDIMQRLIKKDVDFIKKHKDTVVEVAHECQDEEAARLVEKVLLTVTPGLDINMTTSLDLVASYLYVLKHMVRTRLFCMMHQLRIKVYRPWNDIYIITCPVT